MTPTPPPARACSRCGGSRDRGPAQRYCRECFNAYRREREAKRTAATVICKRAGLTVSAGDGGFAIAPSVAAGGQEKRHGGEIVSRKQRDQTPE